MNIDTEKWSRRWKRTKEIMGYCAGVALIGGGVFSVGVAVEHYVHDKPDMSMPEDSGSLAQSFQGSFESIPSREELLGGLGTITVGGAVLALGDRMRHNRVVDAEQLERRNGNRGSNIQSV